jgi:cellulose synthase/poly-beta-1,6-N-acetylglucosamine synthase-like glycosyltransferase
MTSLVVVLLSLLAIPLVVMCAYLFVMALVAMVNRKRPVPTQATAKFRFDIIVPAHNEELGIGSTVANLQHVDYPDPLRRIIVIADNCSDATAQNARDAGALVLERTDLQHRGKGYALAYAFERSIQEAVADAVVVVDADTLVTPNLLHAFSARLALGAQAVQAHYGVRNPEASWRTRLMMIALALFHRVRSLAREVLGVSCGLRGNGMCFRLSLLKEVPHDAFSVVEDVEYGIRLGRAGHRVFFAHEADVLGEMVSGEQASRSQRNRWEQGRSQLVRAHGWPLLRDAFRKKSGLLLDLALDVLVPPLSRLVGWALLGSMLSWACVVWWGVGSAALSLYLLCVSFLVVYVFTGWWLSGVGARGLVDLAMAPLYIAWKIVLLVRKPAKKKDEWVRTTREGETR